MTLLCFTKFLLSKSFVHKTRLSRFSVDVFCLTVLKDFVGETVCALENFWYRKLFCINPDILIFCRKIFVLKYRKLKNFLGDPSLFIKISGIEKFVRRKGISRFSVEVICLTLPKQFLKETFCVSVNFWYRNVFCIGRAYHDFLSRFFGSHYRNISWKNPSVFQKISATEKFSA